MKRGEGLKFYINDSIGLQINVVVSRNASQSAYSAEVPIPPSVTGTLIIAAGLLTPGIRASCCESKTLTPFSLPRWLLYFLIKINQRQSEAEPTILIDWLFSPA